MYWIQYDIIKAEIFDQNYMNYDNYMEKMFEVENDF